MAVTARPLRWGILGTGRVTRWLLDALRASERNEAAAVASRSPETAAAFAREWDLPRAVTGYSALVEDPGIDVV